MADLHGGGGMAAQDFEEEEVWAMMKAREGSSSSPKIRKNLFTSSSSSSSSSSSAWRFTTTSRSIPRSATSSGVHHSSAPLNIPDWSKILNQKPRKKNMWDDDDGGDFDGLKIDGDDYDGHGYDDMLPPHEYLARRLAATQIASFSMCEGVGRTLKGRDLTNLRKKILTKTGFLE